MSLHYGISNIINEKTASFNEIEVNNLNCEQVKEKKVKIKTKKFKNGRGRQIWTYTEYISM